MKAPFWLATTLVALSATCGCAEETDAGHTSAALRSPAVSPTRIVPTPAERAALEASLVGLSDIERLAATQEWVDEVAASRVRAAGGRPSRALELGLARFRSKALDDPSLARGRRDAREELRRTSLVRAEASRAAAGGTP